MPAKGNDLSGALPPPSFLWQGVASLLPVIVLAAIGLVSLAKDRATIEAEARRRAQETAQQLIPALNGGIGWATGDLELLQLSWYNNRRATVRASLKEEPANDPNVLASIRESSQRVAEWKTAHPGLEPADLLPVRVELLDDGRMSFPREYGPILRPPQWFVELTPAQRQLWDNAVTAGNGKPGFDTVAAFAAFQSAVTNSEAQYNARVRAAFAGWGTNVPPDWELQLRRLTPESFFRAESGLPLRSVVLGMAMQLAAEKRLGPPFPDWLGEEAFEHPSLLTSRLLEDYAARIATLPQSRNLVQPIAELRELFQADERSRRMVALLRETGTLRGTNTLTNVWLDLPKERWLAVIDPTYSGSSVIAAGRLTQVAYKPRLAVRFFPRSILSAAAAQVLEGTPRQPGLLEYLSGRITLAGEPILPGNGSGMALNAVLLASAHSVLTQEGVRGMPGPLRGKNNRFEVFPSKPVIEVSLYLARPDLLYAQHYRRVAWFAVVILAAAVVSVLGFLRLRGALLKQYRLAELQRNFVSSASHELRAPIASVRLLAESLDRGKVTDETRRAEYYRLIVQECRRLSALIENVLDFSRINQRRRDYEFEPSDLTELTRQTVQLMQPYAAERQVVLELEVNGKPVSAEVDGKAIQQALVNLIDNAIKHSPSGARVEIGVAVNGDGDTSVSASNKIALWVADQGQGIPADEQKRIFEAFYRRGSELRRETQGIGIGLSIVQHVVAAHGGTITVHSEPGKGSRFAIELPAARNGAHFGPVEA